MVCGIAEEPVLNLRYNREPALLAGEGEGRRKRNEWRGDDVGANVSISFILRYTREISQQHLINLDLPFEAA